MIEAPVVAIIGAGSPSFTPGFVGAIAERPELARTELRLVDIDRDALDLMVSYARRLLRERESSCSVEACPDRGSALDGADFVVVSVDIGGDLLRSLDQEIPARHGVVHVKGDTTGPAGIFRGLRFIPFIVELCREMRRRCPAAMLVNLSNPLSVITRAALREGGIIVVGLCSAIDDMRRDIAGKMGLDPAGVQLDCIGLNHFTWMTGLYNRGRDIMPQFRETALPVFLSDLPITGDLYNRVGCFPVPGYKYASEFFTWYLGPGTHHGQDLGLLPPEPGRREAERNTRSAALAQGLEGSDLLPRPAPDPLASSVAQLVRSAMTGSPSVQNIDMPNRGRIPGLPFDAVVEGPVLVAGQSVRPLCCGSLPPEVVGHLQRAAAEQELVVEAGMRGDFPALREAMARDPLVPSPTVGNCIVDELLQAEADWLPQFRRSS